MFMAKKKSEADIIVIIKSYDRVYILTFRVYLYLDQPRAYVEVYTIAVQVNLGNKQNNTLKVIDI